MASHSRATVVSERMLSDRLVELVVRSPALGADVGVQLLLPKDGAARSAGYRAGRPGAGARASVRGDG
jgi:hypothetical protein